MDIYKRIEEVANLKLAELRRLFIERTWDVYRRGRKCSMSQADLKDQTSDLTNGEMIAEIIRHEMFFGVPGESQ